MQPSAKPSMHLRERVPAQMQCSIPHGRTQNFFFCCDAHFFSSLFSADQLCNACLSPDCCLFFFWAQVMATGKEDLGFLLGNIAVQEIVTKSLAGSYRTLTALKATNSHGRHVVHLLLTEFQEQVLDGSISYNVLRRQVEMYGLKRVTPETKAELVAMHRRVPQGKLPVCFPVCEAFNILRDKHKTRHLATTLRKAVKAANTLHRPAPRHVEASSGIASSRPVFADPLPTNFLTQGLPRKGVYEYHGLDVCHPRLEQAPLLRQHMDGFEAFCLTPDQFDREGRHIEGQRWTSVRGVVMRFLEHIHMHAGVATPDLSHVLNADLINAYMSSRNSSGLKGDTMRMDVSAFVRVINWWAGTEFGKAHEGQIRALLAHLSNVGTQVKGFNPPEAVDPELMMQQHAQQRVNQQPSESVKEVERKRAASECARVVKIVESRQAFVLEVCESSTRELDIVAAREVHDSVMACFMFGFVGATRSQTVRTLISPDSNVRCQKRHCKHKCMGNRIYRSQTVQGKYMMIVSHHKTSRTRGVVQIILPPDLTRLLELYLSKAYPVMKALADAKACSHPFLFMNPFKLNQMQPANFYCRWKQLMELWEGPVVGPHKLRSMFVSERCSYDAVHVAEDEAFAASAAMGNSPATWGKYYLRNNTNEVAQRFVDHQSKWRKAVLAKMMAIKTEEIAKTQLPKAIVIEDDDDELVIDLMSSSSSSESETESDDPEVDE